MKSVGELIRLKRLEKRYTLQKVAKACGVSIVYISKLEKGENTNPSDDIIVSLASVLDMDEDGLFSAFDKTPLNAREKLHENPIFAKAFSQIKDVKNLSEEAQKELREKFVQWYKELAKNDEDD